MSLKAKLEAVIYAAEEPVTLAQLALLFTSDALEWKAEQAAAQAAEIGVTVDEALPEGAAELEFAAAEDATESPVPETATEELAAEASEDEALVEETDAEASLDEAAIAASLKREAKQRDREVRNILRQLLDELIAEYATDNRGVEIREIAGGYRMATKPEYHDVVRAFVKSLKPAMKLSLPALETLAVIAYKQPVTGPEVNEIRGVDSSGVFGSLLARKLIATAGRKPVIGRPILYKTTKEFLMRFGLKDLSELPSMEEFEKMAAEELEEPEAAAEGETAAEMQQELREELSAAEGAEAESESTESAATESTTAEAESNE